MRRDPVSEPANDRGAGLLSMSFGLLFFIILLIFSIQVTYNLYTTSVVTGLAIDAARDVAAQDGISPAQAEANFREFVGTDVDFDIVITGETVEATINWETASLIPAVSDSRAFGVLDRTFAVRIEEQQPAG
jgi:Flp pilus assembly protein TadG